MQYPCDSTYTWSNNWNMLALGWWMVHTMVRPWCASPRNNCRQYVLDTLSRPLFMEKQNTKVPRQLFCHSDFKGRRVMWVRCRVIYVFEQDHKISSCRPLTLFNQASYVKAVVIFSWGINIFIYFLTCITSLL